MTRTVRLVLGVLLLVAGVVFTLQGLDVMGGAAMSGKTLWAVLGPLIAIAGLYLVVTGVRAAPTQYED